MTYVHCEASWYIETAEKKKKRQELPPEKAEVWEMNLQGSASLSY